VSSKTKKAHGGIFPERQSTIVEFCFKTGSFVNRSDVPWGTEDINVIGGIRWFAQYL